MRRNKSIPQVMACRATAGVESFKTVINTGTISGKNSTCLNPISPIILHYKRTTTKLGHFSNFLGKQTENSNRARVFGRLLNGELANGTEPIQVKVEKTRKEFGEQSGVIFNQIVLQLAETIELRGYVSGQIGRVHETRKPFP